MVVGVMVNFIYIYKYIYIYINIYIYISLRFHVWENDGDIFDENSLDSNTDV